MGNGLNILLRHQRMPYHTIYIRFVILILYIIVLLFIDMRQIRVVIYIYNWSYLDFTKGFYFQKAIRMLRSGTSTSLISYQ